jgi:hypothetical protein
VVGKWFALAFAYDAATGAFDPTSTVFHATGTFQCMDDAYLMRPGITTRELVLRISHAVYLES